MGTEIGDVIVVGATGAALAVPFLSEGAALGQRLMYVAENPDPEDMRPLAASGDAEAERTRVAAELAEKQGEISRRAGFRWWLALPFRRLRNALTGNPPWV